MSALSAKSCVPCRGGVPPLSEEERTKLLGQIGDGWRVVDGHHLENVFLFPDFRSSLAFVNRAGEIAEREGHHPDLHLSWGRVRVEIWTHAIDGLTESDFVLAAKLDEVIGD